MRRNARLWLILFGKSANLLSSMVIKPMVVGGPSPAILDPYTLQLYAVIGLNPTIM